MAVKRIVKFDGGRIVRERRRGGPGLSYTGVVSATDADNGCCACCEPLAAACRDAHSYGGGGDLTHCLPDIADDGCFPWRPKRVIVTISGQTFAVRGCSGTAGPSSSHDDLQRLGGTCRQCLSGLSFSGTFILDPDTFGSLNECDYVYRDSAYTGVTVKTGCCNEGGAAQPMTLEVRLVCCCPQRIFATLIDSVSGCTVGLAAIAVPPPCCCNKLRSGTNLDTNADFIGGTGTVEAYCA